MRTNPTLLSADTSGITECLDRLAARKLSVRPVSTYRIQFNAGFRFEDARRLAGYLHALGVSHLYSSPVLKARPGSLHGFDIIDLFQCSADIGGLDSFPELRCSVGTSLLGQVLDLV